MNDSEERNDEESKLSKQKGLKKMCGGCITSFLQNPVYGFVTGFSFLLAGILIALFIIMKQHLTTTKKLLLFYGILFFFFFPAVFYFYTQTCGGSMLYSCNPLQSFFYTTLIAIGISAGIGFIATPFLYRFSSKYQRIPENGSKEEEAFLERIRQYATQLGIPMPSVSVIDTAEPLAFSLSHIKPSIFVTVGLLDLLQKKEVDAVVLHELGHIKQRSSFLKFTNSFIRFLFPIANFNIFHNELDQEEQQADHVAVTIHGTSQYLAAAKQKMSAYYAVQQELNANKYKQNKKHFKAGNLSEEK